MQVLQKTFSNGPFIHRIIVATSILILAVIYFFDVKDLKNPHDRLLISPVFWIMVILYPIIIWQEIREAKKTIHDSEEVEGDGDSYRLTKKVGFFMISVMIYLILLNYIGFIISTILFLPALMWILGTKSRLFPIIFSIIATGLLYLFFDILLGIPLPIGILIEGVL